MSQWQPTGSALQRQNLKPSGTQSQSQN